MIAVGIAVGLFIASVGGLIAVLVICSGPNAINDIVKEWKAGAEWKATLEKKREIPEIFTERYRRARADAQRRGYY